MSSEVPFSVDLHIRLGRVNAIAASPDGSWLAVEVERLDRDGARYVSDLFKVPTTGEPAVRLTQGDHKDSAPAFASDGSLCFLSNRPLSTGKPDEDQEERSQVWTFPVGGGEPTPVTDEPLGVASFKLARAADRLVLLTPVIREVPHDKQRETARLQKKHGPSALRFTEQPVRHWDHFLNEDAARPCTHLVVMRIDGTERVDLTPHVVRELAIEPAFDVSADGQRVALTWQTLGADRELDTGIALIDVNTRVQTLISAGANTTLETPRFSPDGSMLAVLRSERAPECAPRPTLTLVDPRTGEQRALAERWDRLPMLGEWTADGSALFVTADDAGHTPLFRIDTETGLVERITAAQSGGTHVSPIVLAGGRLAVIRSTLLDAPECVILDPVPGATPEPLSRLSRFEPADSWACVENLSVPASDGEMIQAFLIKPKQAGGPFPLLLWIHGGPIGMDQDGWHWRWNPLLAVARGYAVVLPNPRGSTGFGQAFIQGIWGNVWGEQCYRDLMAVADALCARPDLDGARMMAMGGSFGGYMTNFIGTQTDRFKCLITHASISNFSHFTGTTDHPAWWYLELGGEDPYADRERFDRHAPIRHIKGWKTPVLIIHGAQDFRCPFGEGLVLFEALRYHGVEAELLVFPDENHWILKPRNIVAWYEAVLSFIDEHLGEQRSDRKLDPAD